MTAVQTVPGGGIRPADAGIAAALLVLTAAVATGLGGSDVSIAIADLSAAAAASFAAWVVARHARSLDPIASRPWRRLTAALVLWAIGEVLWTYYEVVRGVDIPFPSIADVSYLAAVPFAAAGLLGFVRSSRHQFHLRAVLDGSLIAASLLFIGWALALGPSYRAGAEDLLTHAVSMAYPFTDIVLAALALFVLHWGGAHERRALALVTSALVLMAVADTAFTWLTNNGTYSSSNPLTMLWPAAYLLLAFAARPAEAPVIADADRPQTTASLLLPYGALLAATAVGISRVAGGRSLGPFLTLTGVALVVLVLLRQALTAWELRAVVHRLHQREGQLARLALEDPLTGLPNRARFGERLEEALGAASIRPAVLYLDLDGFKDVNDHFGHAVGDRVLTVAADRLRACCGRGTLVARIGGDEFVVLVDAGEDAAASLAHDLMDAFATPFEHEGAQIALQASIGVAAAPHDGSPDEVVRRADAAMYVAKTTGKGRIVRYPDGLLVRGA